MEYRPIGLNKGKVAVVLIKGAIGVGATMVTAIVDKVVVKNVFKTNSWDAVADILNKTKGS